MSAADRVGRVVVGVDGSASAGSALRWALRQAVLTGAPVHAMACWQWPWIGIGPYPSSDIAGATDTMVRAELAAAVADTDGGAGVPVTTEVAEGPPARLLIDASDGAGVLVVGSRGHTELGGLLLGSVALHCASQAHCPVLVVRGPSTTGTG